MIRRCKSRFNSVKERWCAAGGRAFCSSRTFIGNCNPTGWYGVEAESFNNVISPKDLEFLWRIGNKLMQLSLCSAVAVTWQDGRGGRSSLHLSFLFFRDTAETVFCLRRPGRIFIFAPARCLIFYAVLSFTIIIFVKQNGNKKRTRLFSSSIFYVTFMSASSNIFKIKM